MGYRFLLKHLYIRNFAVITSLDISFDTGMTVFTGETGAGKSILVDALGLAMGDRANNSMVRTNCEYAEITAIFDINKQQDVQNILKQQEIYNSDELMLRRVIYRNGRSRSYVNGSPVPAQILHSLGEFMVDIHGQHEHQSLLKPHIQMELLDEFGDHQLFVLAVKNAWQRWRENSYELETLNSGAQDNDAQIALLQYQVQELEAMQLDAIQLQQLEEEYARLNNASRLIEICQRLLTRLTESEHCLHGQLIQDIKELEELQKIAPSLSSATELLSGAAVQLSEASDELRRYLDRLEIDPTRLQIVETQLLSLYDLARKHKLQPQELFNHLQVLKTKLQQISSIGERYAALLAEQNENLLKYQKAAAELSDLRQQSARQMEADISDKLHTLGMPDGYLTIAVNAAEQEQPHKNGIDKIDYLVKLNLGQAQRSLRKVASGGELSRISLAIQVVANNSKSVPTLIFDEVDSGIGGSVAEIVGKLLHSLADKCQVLCVTHLPQVASLADYHLKVSKTAKKNITKIQVTALDKKQKIKEIARMLGGVKITKQTLAHAEEMLQNS